jgi:hypothetical protein
LLTPPGGRAALEQDTKPTFTEHYLPLAAAGILTVTAALTARADYPSTILGDSPLTYYRFSETTVVPTPYYLRVTNGGGFTNSGSAIVALLPAPSNTYESLIVADAPEAYWRLNEANDGTSIIFDSMGRHDGATRSWGGTVDYGAGFVYAQPGALADNPDPNILFQNANQNLVRVPYSAALNSTPFTFECWANLSSFPADSAYYTLGLCRTALLYRHAHQLSYVLPLRVSLV